MAGQTNGHYSSEEAPTDIGSAPSASNESRHGNDGGQHTAPIAIIGMSCKFGGDATSPTKLWDLCAAGKDGWSPIPKDRFSMESMYHPDSQRFDRVSFPQSLPAATGQQSSVPTNHNCTAPYQRRLFPER